MPDTTHLNEDNFAFYFSKSDTSANNEYLLKKR